MPVFSPLRRCDVVVLDDGNQRYALKRIIGLPGETIEVWRGHVFINRQMLVEPYLPKHTLTCPVEGRRTWVAFQLQAGQFFVMGDNRSCSVDSRSYGPVEETQIKKRIPLPKAFIRAELANYTLPPPHVHSEMDRPLPNS